MMTRYKFTIHGVSVNALKVDAVPLDEHSGHSRAITVFLAIRDTDLVM